MITYTENVVKEQHKKGLVIGFCKGMAVGAGTALAVTAAVYTAYCGLKSLTGDTPAPSPAPTPETTQS